MVQLAEQRVMRMIPAQRVIIAGSAVQRDHRSAEYAAGQNRFKRTLVRDPSGNKYHRSNHAEAGTEKMSVAADRILNIFKPTKHNINSLFNLVIETRSYKYHIILMRNFNYKSWFLPKRLLIPLFIFLL
ncbi:hypothetical protein HOLDEFILI_03448 [Holdemania filiformis DSM 12042]|uniref:Uncharacterized protein n=1 Tax=Holdemania filiformis DSM 12042 TaxID=545696 RepID=B9YC89_9FIRM|nr:hypothetical protein HOLDEFILI_03448 [Holdemania filiformis DSM 12042]